MSCDSSKAASGISRVSGVCLSLNHTCFICSVLILQSKLEFYFVAKNGLISKSFCGKYKRPKRFQPQEFGYQKERVCIFFSAKAKELGENPNAKQGKGWQMVVTAV
jgi:hypothetical protein